MPFVLPLKTGRLRVTINGDGQGNLVIQAFNLRRSDRLLKDNLLPENFRRAVGLCSAAVPSFDRERETGHPAHWLLPVDPIKATVAAKEADGPRIRNIFYVRALNEP